MASAPKMIGKSLSETLNKTGLITDLCGAPRRRVFISDRKGDHLL